jgi:hypothetical protein
MVARKTASFSKNAFYFIFNQLKITPWTSALKMHLNNTSCTMQPMHNIYLSFNTPVIVLSLVLMKSFR